MRVAVIPRTSWGRNDSLVYTKAKGDWEERVLPFSGTGLSVPVLGVGNPKPQVKINRWQNGIRNRTWKKENLHLALLMKVAHGIFERNSGELVWVDDIKVKYPNYHAGELERYKESGTRAKWIERTT